MPEHQLHLLGDILATRTHTCGKRICFDESELEQVMILTAGVLKLTRGIADGRELTIELLYPGDFLGLSGGTAQYTEVWAVSDVTLCCLPKAKFNRLVEHYPELEHEMLRIKLNQLDRARERLITLGHKSAGERVATFLLEIAEHQAGSSPYTGKVPALEFDLPLARGSIADFLGLTVETVSRKVQQLVRDGVITISDHTHIKIQNLPKLQSLSGR